MCPPPTALPAANRHTAAPPSGRQCLCSHTNQQAFSEYPGASGRPAGGEGGGAAVESRGGGCLRPHPRPHRPRAHRVRLSTPGTLTPSIRLWSQPPTGLNTKSFFFLKEQGMRGGGGGGSPKQAPTWGSTQGATPGPHGLSYIKSQTLDRRGRPCTQSLKHVRVRKRRRPVAPGPALLARRRCLRPRARLLAAVLGLAVAPSSARPSRPASPHTCPASATNHRRTVYGAAPTQQHRGKRPRAESAGDTTRTPDPGSGRVHTARVPLGRPPGPFQAEAPVSGGAGARLPKASAWPPWVPDPHPFGAPSGHVCYRVLDAHGGDYTRALERDCTTGALYQEQNPNTCQTLKSKH